VIPFAMFIGLFVGLVGFVSYGLAFPFGFVEYVVLDYVFLVVDMFSKLSFASISIPNFSIWWMLGLYLMYGLLFWFWRHKKKPYQ